MRSGLSQVQEQALMRAALDTMPTPIAAPTTKEIPYDYVAKFKLRGDQPGNRVQDVINISVEGTFVAVAIGYSFIPAKPQAPIPAEINFPDPENPAAAADLSDAGLILSNLMKPSESELGRFAQCLLVRLCGIHFKYSIIDSGTGRELQNQPIHNIAGLGEASGERPFRPLAKPMMFMPRSTIRIEIEEISKGPIYINAELFIVLHGYKILGYGAGLP
jgi:hypothetical protein